MHTMVNYSSLQITALENDDDEGDDDEGTNSSDSTTEVKPTDSPVDDKVVRPNNQSQYSVH